MQTTNTRSTSASKRVNLNDLLARNLRLKQSKNPAPYSGGVCCLIPAPYTNLRLLAACFGVLLLISAYAGILIFAVYLICLSHL